jgi:hypothetical protein
MTDVTIVRHEKGNPSGAFANAERHLRPGRLDGLKHRGVAVWQRRGATGDRVTCPARQYGVNGARGRVAPRPMLVDTSACATTR